MGDHLHLKCRASRVCYGPLHKGEVPSHRPAAPKGEVCAALILKAWLVCKRMETAWVSFCIQAECVRERQHGTDKIR